MNIKIIIFITLLGFSLSTDSYCQENKNVLDNDFTNSLTLRKFGNLQISIPKYLEDKKTSWPNDRFVNFSDPEGTKSISIIAQLPPIDNGLKKIVPSRYELKDKTYNPGESSTYLFWNRTWKDDYDKIEKTQKIDFGDFHGFMTKGKRKSISETNPYWYQYELFKKGDDDNIIIITIQSANQYFLNDEQSDYVVNTLKENT